MLVASFFNLSLLSAKRFKKKMTNLPISLFLEINLDYWNDSEISLLYASKSMPGINSKKSK